MRRRNCVRVIAALAVVLVAQTATAQTLRAKFDVHAAIRDAVARDIASGVLSRRSESATRAGDWARVERLDAGARIRIVERSGAETTGRIEHVTADAISLVTVNGSTTFEQTRIDAVKIPSLTKRVVYGSLGVVGGVIGGFLLCPSCINEGNPGRVHRQMTVLGALGSVCFLFPQESTIYRAPKP